MAFLMIFSYFWDNYAYFVKSLYFLVKFDILAIFGKFCKIVGSLDPRKAERFVDRQLKKNNFKR